MKLIIVKLNLIFFSCVDEYGVFVSMKINSYIIKTTVIYITDCFDLSFVLFSIEIFCYDYTHNVCNC